ncbi:MAG: GPR endopeptidase [Clostridia bacterium]|nr:GPR endopeptidase [Clostridia bacterium]
MTIRCDLAVDMAEGLDDKKGFLCNVIYGKYNVKREDITVTPANSEIKSGVARGRYVTVIRGNAEKRSEEEKRYFIKVLAKAISDVLSSSLTVKPFSVLVIGLGNGYMTADALGKKVCEKIICTRSISDENSPFTSVCSFAASVAGITGIDSFEVVNGLKDQVKPDAVICVDSLSAFRTDRIGRAFQVSNAGIRAGGGSGKPSRYVIDESSIGVPVISVGVPFVVSARKMLKDVYGEELSYDPIFPEDDMFVTPRDVDGILKECSEVIATAVNLALNPEIGLEQTISMTS